MAGPTNTQFAVAVHALTLLTSDGGTPQSSERMSTSIAANPVYLRRVLGRLRDAGYVDSRSGRRGGWHLAKPASEITLGDAWRAVQEDASTFGLHGVVPGCPVGASVSETLRELDQQLTEAMVRELDGISLLQVLPEGAGDCAAGEPELPSALPAGSGA